MTKNKRFESHCEIVVIVKKKFLLCDKKKITIVRKLQL